MSGNTTNISKYLFLCGSNLLKIFLAIYLALALVVYPIMVTWAITTDHVDEMTSFDSFLFSLLMLLSLTIFIFILAIVSEYFEFRVQERLFNERPFSELEKLRFRTVDLFKKSLLKLFQLAYVTQINGYQIVARMHTKNSVSFSILTESHVYTRYELPDGFNDSQLILRFIRSSVGCPW